MRVTRRFAGLAVSAIAAVALPIMIAPPAQAACAPGTYPPSNCAPTVTLHALPRFTLGRSTPSWSPTYYGAGIAKYQARYNRAAWSGTFQGWVYPAAWQDLHTTYVTHILPIGSTYCYSVRAVDNAGRVGPWSTSRCTARPLDDRAMTASAGWSRNLSSNFYLGTYTNTARLNAKLYRTNAYVARIGVVGTSCRYCGTVYIYVGTTRVGAVNFYSATTHYKQIRVTNAFSVRRGTITLKNVVSGTQVFIDGLGVSRV